MSIAEYAVFAFSSLFVIVDPIAAVAAFIAMTARDSVAQRVRTARVACVVTVLILAGFGPGSLERTCSNRQRRHELREPGPHPAVSCNVNS